MFSHGENKDRFTIQFGGFVILKDESLNKWKEPVHYQVSTPSTRETTCSERHKRKKLPSPPLPRFCYLVFRMKAGLVRRWGSSERRVCKVQNKSLCEGHTGWAISGECAVSWGFGAAGGWVPQGQQRAPGAEKGTIRESRITQTSKWNGPKVIPVLLKYLGIIEWE